MVMGTRVDLRFRAGRDRDEGPPRSSDLGGTIVAIPSLSLPYFGTPQGANLAPYEERILYLLHTLKNPKNRLVIVTSTPVPEAFISYLLHLLPGIPYSHARRRLELFAVQDHSSKPLTQKILERPLFLARLRATIAGASRAALSCYTVTELEAKLALELGIPVYGPSPEHLKLATKSVVRQIFRDLEIALPPGAEHLSSLTEVIAALVTLAREDSELKVAVLKQNYSIGGYGNVTVSLGGLRGLLATETNLSAELEERLAKELPSWMGDGDCQQVSWSVFWDRFQEAGGAAEAWLEGTPCSVKVRVRSGGQVEVLATHDELLDCSQGRSYVSCRMPAASDIAPRLAALGRRVGERLADLGVVGRFDVDFLACHADEAGIRELYALDINLRKGHTTLPIRTLQLLTGGSYDEHDGVFRCGIHGGTELYYRATDHFGADLLYGLLPRDLVEMVSLADLHYSSATGMGALFHMLGSMSERGRAGVTCIGHSHSEADEVYATVLDAVLRQRSGYAWIT